MAHSKPCLAVVPAPVETTRAKRLGGPTDWSIRAREKARRGSAFAAALATREGDAWTLAAVARRMGVSSTTVRSMLTGRLMLERWHLERLGALGAALIAELGLGGEK